MFFTYGSTVYGTTHENSDVDIAVIGEPTVDFSTQYTDINAFERAIIECDPIALECYSLLFHPDKADLFHFDQELTVSIPSGNLRRSISSKSSNSFVKAKKKLTVDKDFDKMASLKSLFHSMRLLTFGTQIATEGHVVDFGAENELFAEIWDCYQTDDIEGILDRIQSEYKPQLNARATIFRKVAQKGA